MSNVVAPILLPLTVLLGAGDICFAIIHFNQKHYFRFGMWTMFAIWSVLMMIKLAFWL